MSIKLSSKIAVVTGGTRGIGRAITIDLLKRGYFVFCNYNTNKTTAEEAELVFSEISDNFELCKYDLSDIKSIEDISKYIHAKTDKIDVIVLNAATTCKKEFNKISFEEWMNVMNVNLNMPFFLLQKLDDLLVNGGRVIAISAILGQYPHSISIPYGVSKSGLNHLVKSLVKIYSGRKITINAISPSFVETDWQKTKPNFLRNKIENKIALKRFANPEEISNLAMAVIENDYINGSIVNIDGGYDYE